MLPSTKLTKTTWRSAIQLLQPTETHLGSHVKCQLLLYEFNKKLELVEKFRLNSPISYFIAIRLALPECFIDTDRQTEKIVLTGAMRRCEGT